MASCKRSKRSSWPAALVLFAASCNGCDGENGPGTTAGDEQSRELRIEALGLHPDSMLAPGCTKMHHALLYHDCQAVIEQDGSYGPTLLSAIDSDLFFVDESTFAELPADSVIRVGTLTNKGPQQFAMSGRVVFDGGTIHCLYLGRPQHQRARWRAMFADCTADPTDLATRIVPWMPTDSLLHVERITGGPVPNTATLDWDENHRRQIMGIRCGDAWCIVSGWGPPTLRPLPNTGATGNRDIRGWHDQQVLAVPASPTQLQPGTAVATLMAEPGLEALTEPAFTTPRLVARAHFTVTDPVYQRKFNLDATSAGSENEIRIGRTGARWFADIQSASGTTVRFRVVRRPDMAGIDPPGSVRWGWLEDDENLWVRCGSGCCEITPFRLVAN